MEATNYTSIGPVLQLNKAGELAQKRMKAAKVCDGLYVTAPDKRDFVRYIIECNGVMWVESTQSKSYAERYAAAMPEALKKVKAGFYGGENCNNFCREIDRRINHPEAPVIMELQKPERKKPEPLPEGAKKVSVYMFKGCTAETTDKKVVITELAPHIYTYTYKLKKYGERVKVVFEIDGVYFEAVDKDACYMERKDFAEVCAKAYASARKNVAGAAAQGMPYFVELQKRIDAATPSETPQISTEAAETVNVSAEGEKEAERAENAPKRKIQYFHYTPEQLKRYIIDVYEKNANGEWVLQPYEQIDTDAGLWDVVDGKIGWWTNWRREKFSEMNMDFNSPTCGRCCKINRTYQTENYVVSNEKLLEFTINGGYHYINKQTYNSADGRKEFYTIIDNYDDCGVNDTSDTLEGIMQRFDKYYKERATIIWQSPEFAPQSPETPKTVDCAANTPKPRETARNPQNRGIGNTRHSRLGANGYAMLDNASATLTAMSVPRECSTADVAYW